MKEQELINKGYIEGKKSFEYLAKEIFDNFNWKRVHKAMKAVDWFWKLGEDEDGKDRMGIPDIITLKRNAARLLKEAYDKELSMIGSGGFSAGWDSGELYLSFTLSEASA